MGADFVHLRSQSSYSMLESAVRIDDLSRLARENNMPAIALTDRGNMFGALEFSLSASSGGIQPINGVLLNLAFNNSGKTDFGEILLLAKNDDGYKNLLALSSYIFIKNDRKICNHITFEDLKNHCGGLIALSGYHMGIVGRSLAAKNPAQAAELTDHLKSIFCDNLYFEIMRHGDRREQNIEHDYVKLAIKHDLPLVATNNILFAEQKLHEIHDVLLCVSQGVTTEHQDRKRVSNQSYFKSSDEMAQLFADIPGAMENSINIARRCCVAARSHDPMLPSFEDPQNPSLSEDEIIKLQTRAGLKERLRIKFAAEKLSTDEQSQIEKQYSRRLEYELGIICKMQFSGYFLIVSDFIKWSKEQGIAVGPGRGSGAGSIVAWSLLITDLDPIKFGLIFERFLNPERKSMPDFDIDFCQKRREEVIEYVCARYGRDRVGHIITFGKMQAKAVIKDVARVLSLPYKFADRLTELVPFNAINPVTLSQAINEIPELGQAARGDGLFESNDQAELIKQVLETSLVLEGLHRHASVHAAGVVISSADLIDVVPLYKDMHSDMLIIQYSMKFAESAGLMKFDFLGLQTLTIINACIDLLKEQNITVDFLMGDFDDSKTYEMLATGHSTGVFQFESIGMKDTLRKLKPDSVHDLIALGALYRPGPMENIPTYIACKHKRQEPQYLHPLLEDTLRDTYGVIIYQEQVMEIARILACYSMGKADMLRSAMGKKNKAKMQEQEKEFIKGAESSGNLTAARAKEIFDIVAKFAGYGFNKAHASAYGVISYQTAYLKANFPVEFLVVCMNLDIDNDDKINMFLQEARILKIHVAPPDINESSGQFTIQNKAGEKYISYALGAIKGVTVSFGDVVADERGKRGVFKDIIDFVERVPLKALNRRSLENLVHAGSFDGLHDNRGQLLASIYPGSYKAWLASVKGDKEMAAKFPAATPALLAYAASFHRERSSKQFSLLQVSDSSANIFQDNVPATTKEDLAVQEFDALGCFLVHHPLIPFMDMLKEAEMPNSSNLGDIVPQGAGSISIAGFIQKKDARMSTRGKFLSLQLSDPYGIFDITIFSDQVLRDYSRFIEVKKAVIVSCDTYRDKGGIRLTAKSFKAVEDVICSSSDDIELYCRTKSDIESIIKCLQGKETSSGGRKVQIHLPVESEYFISHIDLGQEFDLSPRDLKLLASWRSK